MSWGGARKGSGRPKGTVKAEGARAQHQVRAYPDEWELIMKFARLIKHGEKGKCAEFLNQFE